MKYTVNNSSATLHIGPAETAYETWPTPDLIVSDGAYGIGGFPGDPKTPDALADWYQPHIEAWSKAALPHTVLFFWNTEVGWAKVHPELIKNGWKYVQLITWDKGLGQIAGNVNSKTIRSFPVVTEVCGFYTREPVFESTNKGDGSVSMQTWLRDEWARTGLPFKEANAACGLKDAVTRKYMTKDTQWYMPPPEMLEKLETYANQYGDPAGVPYFVKPDSLGTDGDWVELRYQWNHTHGLTNVWNVPSLRGKERLKVGAKSLHLNQKPMELMRRCVRSVGTEGDVVWEPFGGTGTVAAACLELGRHAFVAESNPLFSQALDQRLSGLAPSHTLETVLDGLL